MQKLLVNKLLFPESTGDPLSSAGDPLCTAVASL